MNRRMFIGTVAVGLVGAPVPAVAQQAAKVPRIGILLPGAATPGQPSPLLDAFRGGLRDLGYVEGRNVLIETRWSDGRNERVAELTAELVRLEVAVIVTQGAIGVQAAKTATGTIPIVMAFVGDPVALGVAASLARPGANITGLSLQDADLDGKRIELLKEVVPGLTRLAMLWSANDSGMTLAFNRVEVAARALGLSVQSLAVLEPDDFARAFQAVRGGRAEALIVQAQPFTMRHRAEILDLVAAHRLPAIYTLRSFVDTGGLMSYGPSVPDLYRRAASYVDKILRGAKPADLPIEQPKKFELVINLKTAKVLGVTMPRPLLLRADEVLE